MIKLLLSMNTLLKERGKAAVKGDECPPQASFINNFIKVTTRLLTLGRKAEKV